MDKIQEILYHIEELYSEKPSQFKIEQMCKSNPVKYQAWVDAFKDYDLSDVLTAIDEYWEFKNSKTKPNVAQIKAILNMRKAEKIPEVEEIGKLSLADLAWSQMNLDIENGVCRNNLYVYRDAERIILEDWLLHEVPTEVWRKMSYASRLKVATEKGLTARFSEALTQAAQKRFGRDYEFESEKDMEARKSGGNNANFDDAAKYLAAHWKMGA